MPANNSAPLDSANLEPGLSVAFTGGLTSSAASRPDGIGKISTMDTAAKRQWNLIIATDLRTSSRVDRMASRPHDARMQPRDGVERRQDRALLPRRTIGSMFNRKTEPAINLASIVVVLFSGRIGPHSGAPHREGHPVPGYRNPVFEFGFILGMNPGAQFDRARDPIGRGHRRKFVRIYALKNIGS